MEDTDIRNEKVARFIWNNSLQRSHLPFTWNLDFNTVQAEENGTSFYCGRLGAWVIIQMQEDNLFSVAIEPEGSEYEENGIIYESVPLEKVVPLIDENVRYGLASYDYICGKLGLHQKLAVW